MKYLEGKKKQGTAGKRKHESVMICQKLEIIRRHRWLKLRRSYGFTQYLTVNYIWHKSFHPSLCETHLGPLDILLSVEMKSLMFSQGRVLLASFLAQCQPWGTQNRV
jgi:hypothetical protein